LAAIPVSSSPFGSSKNRSIDPEFVYMTVGDENWKKRLTDAATGDDDQNN
jgi:hypothetical protein